MATRFVCFFLLITHTKGVTSMGKLMFIHVGKAGGATVRHFLWDQGCEFTEVHTRVLRPAAVNKHDLVILNTRDPTDRVLSAFKYRHLIGGEPTTPRFRQHRRFEEALFGCFPTATSFAQAFLNGSDVTGECRRLAHEATRPTNTSFDAGHHLAMGLSYYVKNVMPELRKKPVYVTHANQLDAELRSIGNFLGKELLLNVSIGRVHADYSRHAEQVSDPRALEALRAALSFEYAMLAEIEALRWRGWPHAEQ